MTVTESMHDHSPYPTQPESPPAPLLASLRALRRAAVAGHLTPDADSIGSALALTLGMRNHGIDACFVLPGRQASRRLSFMLELAESDAIREDLPDAHVADQEGLIVVDTAAPRRINLPAPFDTLTSRHIINIDHHLSNTRYGALNWVDASACSSSQLIWRLLHTLAWPLTPPMASLLYAGIHGDTGGFSLPNTTADSLVAAAALVRSGADVGRIGEKLCRSQSWGDIDLLRRVYDHTRLTDDGRIAYSFLTHEDHLATNSTAEDIDDQVAIPRSLAGIRIALLFTEAEPGTVRINLRGEGNTSVLAIAQEFGGGGHAQSACVRVRNKPMETVIADVLAVAQRHIDSV